MTSEEPEIDRLDGIEALLFDLGGVVIEIDFTRAFKAWSKMSGLSVDAIGAAFSMDEAYESHEIGTMDGRAFFESLGRTLELDLAHGEFVAGWNSIYVGLVDGIGATLGRAAGSHRLCAFTNSNPTHMQAVIERFAQTLSLFETVFVSSEIGRRKPNADAFALVAERVGLEPQQILFFDDTLENVEGAEAFGMPAVHVRSLADVLAVLDG